MLSYLATITNEQGLIIKLFTSNGLANLPFSVIITLYPSLNEYTSTFLFGLISTNTSVYSFSSVFSL